MKNTDHTSHKNIVNFILLMAAEAANQTQIITKANTESI